MANANSNGLRNRFKDLTGKRFGKWSVLHEVPHSSGRTYWKCRCECGKEQSIKGSELTGNRTRSCRTCSNTGHGLSDSQEYAAWQEMKTRCNNPNSKDFPAYGGNGKAVCAGWMSSFESFYADIGNKPSPSHSNDRIDGSKGYSCGHCEECVSNGWTANCRWATPREQTLNSSHARMITFQGETFCLKDWAAKVGINYQTLHTRIQTGWSIERALTTPVQQRRQE